MGMGYRYVDRVYELVGIDPADGGLESLRSILPFEHLCDVMTTRPVDERRVSDFLCAGR